MRRATCEFYLRAVCSECGCAALSEERVPGITMCDSQLQSCEKNTGLLQQHEVVLC